MVGGSSWLSRLKTCFGAVLFLVGPDSQGLCFRTQRTRLQPLESLQCFQSRLGKQSRHLLQKNVQRDPSKIIKHKREFHSANVKQHRGNMIQPGIAHGQLRLVILVSFQGQILNGDLTLSLLRVCQHVQKGTSLKKSSNGLRCPLISQVSKAVTASYYPITPFLDHEPPSHGLSQLNRLEDQHSRIGSLAKCIFHGL